ncbi:tape measure protein [Microbacterium phage Hortus1]|nr:tape measure protein [Microbacterium phage Hortus1]AWY05619.1 tape measure protein [Microbacterium phage OlinDD]AWY06378.1 tape measure protein [Microbacterium phage Tandem]
MADPVNVQFNVTEKGFDKILRDVGLLRSELEALGVDVSGPVQRALNGIETTSVKVSRSTREAANAYKAASRDVRDLAAATKAAADAEENLTQAQQRRRNQISAERTARTNQGQGGSDYRNASTSIDAIIAARREQNAIFTNQIEQRLRGEAEEARKTAQAVDRLTTASARRAKVEEDYYRNRYRQNNRQALADFDAEFKQLEELQRLNEGVTDPSARYALYDVAAGYAAIGAALAGVAIYAGVVGAEFQSSFTNVVRTTNPQIEDFDGYIQNLRNSLVQLSGQIPLTFSELSQIATLGNQLGIAEDSLEGFTSTVARFSSVSGVSIEEVSRAFGGIRAQTGLAEQYFENLGAAMSLVSVRSNATEAQIISLTREIASTTSGAGFAIDEVVGLAGALASLQVAPERARGVIDTYFNRLNTAVREGGEGLDSFARVTGLAREEIARLVKSGEGVEVFRSVLQGLRDGSADVTELDANLEALGLTGLRASNTFNRFVNSLNVADESFANAREGFIEGAELQRQYALTVQDLSSQFTIFINGINALVDAVSGGGIQSIAALLQVINNVIFALTEWVGNNRFVAGLIGFGIAVAGIAGTLLLVRAGLTVATAATYAARTAIAQLGGASVAAAGTLRGFLGALLGVQGGLTGVARAANIAKIAIRGLLVSTLIGGVVAGLGFLAEQFFQVDDKAGDAALSLAEYEKATRYTGLGSDGAAGSADNLADSLGGAGKAAEEAAIKVRTLADYVSDLNGVFRRSSEIRFGSQEALDNITLKWIELNEEIEKYQQQVRSLTADRELKAYFLGIAEAYDDQLRAAQLREEIAKIDDDLAKAQAGASTELTGNSKAAIENRRVFRDLLGSYEDYVSALSAAGASQEQIQAVISQLNTDFVAQATSLGYNSGELVTYTQRFQDLATIVAQVPRDITVTANVNPALQALNEFFAVANERARQAGVDAGNAYGNGLGGGIGGFNYDDLFPKGIGKSQGRGVAKNWWEEFLNFLDDVFVKWPEQVSKWVESAYETVVTEGGKQGEALWNGFTTWLQQQFSRFGDFFTTLFGTPVETVALGQGQVLGDNVGNGVINGTRNRLNQDNSVNNWISNQNNSAFSNGDTVGRNIGGGILAGLNNTLSLGRVRGPVLSKGGGYSEGGYVGFSSGGYTGPGHWLQPAGIVHAGEYVIPKKHVNQSTGLPDPTYVANLQRGRSAPAGRGYANGGFVGGNDGPIELGPVSLGAIMNGLSVRLNVGREQLARATSGGNSRLAFTGSN